MRYHIKEKLWSLTEAFIIRDDQNKPVYEIHGKFFHIGDNLVLHDKRTKEEVAHIKQHVIAFLPHYEIYRHGQHLLTLHGKFNLFGERLRIEGNNGLVFHIGGDILQWNFNISDGNGSLLAQVGREFSSDKESYGIETSQGADDPTIVALVITIDMLREHHAQKEERKEEHKQ